MTQKYLYIYNVKQNDFFVNNGLHPINVGKGESGSVYLKYIRDEKAETILTLWKNKSNLICK